MQSLNPDPATVVVSCTLGAKFLFVSVFGAHVVEAPRSSREDAVFSGTIRCIVIGDSHGFNWNSL